MLNYKKMQITEIDKEEYKLILSNPFSVFESVDFCEINKHKVEKMKFFLFNDRKNRFCLVAGIKKWVS